VLEVDSDTAPLAPRVAGPDRDDLIACVDQLVKLTPYALPRLPELPPRPPEALLSTVDLSLDQTLHRTPSIVEFDIGVVERKNGRAVAASRRIEQRAHDLHILLRHRPPSISLHSIGVKGA
jgi:hypothetical protein